MQSKYYVSVSYDCKSGKQDSNLRPLVPQTSTLRNLALCIRE